MRWHLWAGLGLAAVAAGVLVGEQGGLWQVLSSTAKPGKQPGEVWLLPSNQLLKPWGTPVLMKGRPVDVCLSADQRLLAVLNWRGVEIYEAATGALVGEAKSRSTSYAGVAFRPGTREVWASEATRNGPDGILIATLDERGRVVKEERMALKPHPVPVGIAFSKDGGQAFVAFSRNNTLAVIDAGKRAVMKEVETGVAPFSVDVSQTAGKVFVSNRGGRKWQEGQTAAPTSGGRIAANPVTGSSASGTVTAVDLASHAAVEIGAGLAPAGLRVSPDGRTVAVANAHSDSVTLIDAASLKTREVKLPAWPAGTSGSIPAHAAWSPKGDALYVLLGGMNAAAVVRGGQVAGAMPTGWFPSGITVDGSGAVRVVCIKGVGSTDRGDGTFNSRAYEGMLQQMPAPDGAALAAGLREVRAANAPRMAKAGGIENLRALGIEHTFLIIKENRTYDQVFGAMGKGNGEPKLAIYGGDVTPNHQALASRYVLLDNFYTTSSISFDGHQWLMMAFVSDYTQRAFAASPRGYAWDMSDALTVSPAGFFWQGAPPSVTVRVFGEFCLPGRWNPERDSAEDIDKRALRSWTEYWRMYQEGKWQDQVGCSAAGLPALKPLMSTRYPQDDTVITDQIRASEFLRELGESEKSGRLANINILTLTSDHTNGTQPGSPVPKAMVADNDLAVGRIVEGISSSRFWKKSLILIVEDDAQDGLDHVDGHRTVALMVGPHVRRGAVDSNNYNQLSMIRTIQEIFRIPARTPWLKNARAMTSVFTAEADAKPYVCIPAQRKLDEMNPPLKALNGRRRWAAEESARMNWADVDDIPSDTLNRILWWDAKGYNEPYPALTSRSSPSRR
ncbi:MAG: bifunctional YncE family protein/alkaline phosphatase family protein [Acidobacteria bacterium]|nr:bifunctional YncE family protein/alkaline phosphatase family protein [Acidobacteriota bacterium]